MSLLRTSEGGPMFLAMAASYNMSQCLLDRNIFKWNDLQVRVLLEAKWLANHPQIPPVILGQQPVTEQPGYNPNLGKPD